MDNDLKKSYKSCFVKQPIIFFALLRRHIQLQQTSFDMINVFDFTVKLKCHSTLQSTTVALKSDYGDYIYSLCTNFYLKKNVQIWSLIDSLP